MSSDNEMAASDVSMAESAFPGVAEAPRGAGARAAGDGATRVALREQITRLETTTGWNAQVEAMSRAAHKTQLWNILREHVADDPALVQAVSELERLDEVSPSSRPSFGQMQDAVPERFYFSGRGSGHARGCAWPSGHLHPQRPWEGG